MAWFAAHIVTYFKWKDPGQQQFRIYENVHLIKAETVEEARAKANVYGQRSEGDDRGSLISDGHPATCVFAGIRRIITVAHEADEPTLGDGDEVTFLPFIVDNEAAVYTLAANQPTRVLYFEELGPPDAGDTNRE